MNPKAENALEAVIPTCSLNLSLASIVTPRSQMELTRSSDSDSDGTTAAAEGYDLTLLTVDAHTIIATPYEYCV